ncbi:MAG: SPOR domain-containing protein [Paludibacter sp.]|nr:SPOR domain-containing protein [Paludibacter sp.]
MNKTIRLTLALAVVMLATSACKTKQKIAEIPAGANIEATAPRTVVTKPTPAVTPQTEQRVASNETEVTRNENFSLAEGETNTDALKYKYHVVVGSFTKQDNAKGLKSKLINEGNKAIVVVNEKGMFRVLMTSVNDYQKAHAFIKNISTRFPDAWVLVQK